MSGTVGFVEFVEMLGQAPLHALLPHELKILMPGLSHQAMMSMGEDVADTGDPNVSHNSADPNALAIWEPVSVQVRAIKRDSEKQRHRQWIVRARNRQSE